MSNGNSTTPGIELLLEKYRSEFRRPKNTDYYVAGDYKEAERKLNPAVRIYNHNTRLYSACFQHIQNMGKNIALTLYRMIK